MQQPLDTDVAIVGAGVVGCAIARELPQFDLRVTLLEAAADVGAGSRALRPGARRACRTHGR